MSKIVDLKQGKQKIKMQKNVAIYELERISKLREDEEKRVYFDGVGTGAKYRLYSCYFHQLQRAINPNYLDGIPF